MMNEPRHILLVCTGNTCRSPMAAHLLQLALKGHNLDKHFVVSSAGIAAVPGQPAAAHAIEAMAAYGASLEGHRSRSLDRDLVDAAWLILTMTQDHKESVLRLFPQAQERVYTLGEFAGEPFGPAWEVPDPYGQSAEVYRSTGEALRRALERVAQRLAEGRIMEKRGVSGLKVAFGCDHAGIDLREPIRSVVEELGHSFLDFGPQTAESVDYPDFGAKVARTVASGEADLGIVVCGTGIGISIAANKVKGVRAALCSETYSARMSREHNNANVLALGARVVGPGLAQEIVRTFLTTEFAGGRHQTRVDKISALEE